MKDYLGAMVDLTGDSYLNPVPAVYDNGEHPRDVSVINSISVHHDAEVRPHDYNSVERYHGEAAVHYATLGPGLQYHYVIDNTGVIFKIRPHALWLYTVGSAENVTTLAIKLDGYFHPPYNQKPTREQYEALGQLLVKLCEQSPEFPATYPQVRPHRDFSATVCPGDLFAPWVYAIQSKADVLNVPADAEYDWPSQQPDALTGLDIMPTPAVAPSPLPVAPAIPAPVVNVPEAAHLDPIPAPTEVLPPKVTVTPPADVPVSKPVPSVPVDGITPAKPAPLPEPTVPQAPTQVAVKPGIKTTEFYVTVVAMLLPVVNWLTASQFNLDQVSNFLVSLFTVSGSVIAAITYIVSRTALKQGEK